MCGESSSRGKRSPAGLRAICHRLLGSDEAAIGLSWHGMRIELHKLLGFGAPEKMAACEWMVERLLSVPNSCDANGLRTLWYPGLEAPIPNCLYRDLHVLNQNMCCQLQIMRPPTLAHLQERTTTQQHQQPSNNNPGWPR